MFSSMMNGDKMHPPAKTACTECTKLNECEKNNVRKTIVCCTNEIKQL